MPLCFHDTLITSQSQGLHNWQPRAQFDPPLDSVNKVFLEHSHTHPFMYCLWLLSHDNVGVEWLWQSLKYLLPCPLQKEFGDPCSTASLHNLPILPTDCQMLKSKHASEFTVTANVQASTWYRAAVWTNTKAQMIIQPHSILSFRLHANPSTANTENIR